MKKLKWWYYSKYQIFWSLIYSNEAHRYFKGDNACYHKKSAAFGTSFGNMQILIIVQIHSHLPSKAQVTRHRK